MRPHAVLFALLALGCPKPAPVPVAPSSNELVCGLEEADHDEAVDHVVTALQVDATLDRWVTKYGRDAITCVVEEVVVDVRSAPVLVSRAQRWLGGSR